MSTPATPLTMVLSSTRSAPTTSGVTTRYWHTLVMKSAPDFITLAQSDGTTTDYFAYDGLGSVRQLVDATGSVGLAQTFDPYGNGYASAGSAQSMLGYTGEQIDANGFVYLYARYYQPGMGRFMQLDPSRAERNPYQYSASNPIMFFDPSGLLSCDKAEGLRRCYLKLLDKYAGLEALKQLYTNEELDQWKWYVGDNAYVRTSWILTAGADRNTWTGLPAYNVQQGALINATGVRDEFYEDEDGQLGTHFMQGVLFGFDVWWGDTGIKYAIGHEIHPEYTNIAAASTVSDTDLYLFKRAMYDMYGDPATRDERLLSIFTNNCIEVYDDGTTTSGGSMQDMRLWPEGIRFGTAMRKGWTIHNSHGISVKTRGEAAEWLQSLLGE